MHKPIKIENVPIDSIRAHPRNSRVHNELQYSHLEGSLTTFNQVKPAIVNEAGVILAGHGMWEAAKRCGFTTISVVRLTGYSEAQQRAYLLLDNRLAELSHFERTILAEELTFLIEEKVSLNGTGFSMTDVDRIVETAMPGAPLGPSEQDEPELPDLPIPPVSKFGDLWSIGAHRMLCGDARDSVSYDALLAGELAQMAILDPPFNVPTKGHISSGKGKAKHRDFICGAGELSDSEFIALLRASFRHIANYTVDGAIIDVFIDWRHARHVQDAADGVFTEHKQTAVWDKGSGALGSFYRSQHEFVLIFKSGRAPHINHFSLGEKGAEFGKGGKGRYRTNIWRAPGMSSFHPGRDALKFHSTVKPVGLIAEAILDVSDRGGLVLDNFAGSGTTILAAQRTGRRAACIELDPGYVDTAIQRIEAATGLVALHADGETFASKLARAGEEN